MIIGIDPGKKGGIALVSAKGGLTHVYPMPEAEREIVRLLRLVCGTSRHGLTVAYVEKVGAMPGNGVVSMFSFGRNVGILIGTLHAEGVPVHEIRPKEWQTICVKNKPTPKSRALATARKLWPGQAFLATKRSKIPHDGMIDAALIAEYGRRQAAANVDLRRLFLQAVSLPPGEI